jgi:hypothetical protein
MKELNKENIQNYVIEFSKIFGIDFEEKLKQENSKALPIGEYFFSKDIFGVYKLAEENKLIESLITLNDVVIEHASSIRVKVNNEYLRNLSSNLLKIADILDYYNHHNNILMDQYVNAYKDFWLFKGNDLKKELGSLDILPRIDMALEKNLFKTYAYHIENKSIPEKNSKFLLNQNLYIVDSINSFLKYAKKENNDDIKVTYILKIEDIIEYSYFCLVIQYKGNVWVGTDKIMFANPNNKYHRRNPTRSREEYFEYLDLPYIILDNIDKIRQDTKVPVPNAGFELHVLKMVDLHVYHKAFMNQLAAHVVNTLNNENIQKIASYEDVVLSLPSGEDIRKENNFSNNRFDGVEERINEIESFLNENSKELAIINKDVVLKSEHYDPEWLATPESLQNLNNWIANDKIRNEYEEKLDKLYSQDYKQKDKLHNDFSNILSPYINNIFQYAFIANEVVIIIHDNISKFGSDNNTKTIRIFRNDEHFKYSTLSIRDYDIKYPIRKGNCKICNNHTESKNIILSFDSAKQVQLMFGMKWEEIPDWFKLYKSSVLIPYHGNSILDNVNPLAMMQDNVSLSYQNGFKIGIHMCGYCFNRLVKQYKKYDKANINYDAVNNKIISIEERIN